jgi:hypothetical protein
VNSFKQSWAVCAVNDADVEIGAERLDCGRREFFGDKYDGLSHEYVFPWVLMRTRGSSLPEQCGAVLR